VFSGFSLLALHFAISFYVVFKKNTLTFFSLYNKITDVPCFLNLKSRGDAETGYESQGSPVRKEIIHPEKVV